MRIALVGAEFEENLAVRYLRGALERAGHEVRQIVFNAASDAEAVARALAETRAPLAGLSMVFTHRAREFARVAARARELGFDGHIVAGGHFAAFHAEQLLSDVPALDSVAIGEGEELMLELAQSLDQLGAVSGLVWRDGASTRRNPPRDKTPDLDQLARPPRKRPLDDYLGLPITNILSSRGCAYSCTFCSIVAWHRLCGGDRVRMRTVEAVADEMADLYRDGARIFNFHDDNFFLPDRSATLERIRELGRALATRGVGRIAFAIKARPDAVDDEIFEALKEIGLFRVFLGIEAGSAESLKQLGRRQTVAENEHALEVVNRHDIHTAFNLLLLNPDSSLEDVAANVRFLRAHPDNPTNFCRTEIYAGTPLEKKLRREGRLLGDYWGYDYVIADARAQLAFELIYPAFHSRNYGDRALHHVAMQVDYEHQLLAHFFGTRTELRRRVKRFLVSVNENTAGHLDTIVARVGRGFGGSAERETFLCDVTGRIERDNARLGSEGAELVEEIRALATRREHAGGWGRAVRVVGLAASVTLAAAGCKKTGDDTHATEMVAAPPTLSEGPPIPPPDAEAPDASATSMGDAAVDASLDASLDAPVDAAHDAEAPRDAAPDAKVVKRPVPKPPATTHPSEMAPRPPRPPSHYNEMIAEPPDVKPLK